MKYIIFFSIIVLVSCKRSRQNTHLPLAVTDTVTLEAKQKRWLYMVDDPGRGKVKLELSNYTDSLKTFVVTIQEIGN